MKPTYEELEARCAALAAEVYDLKHPGTYLPTKRETPALDAFLRKTREQGINYAAGRLAAAYNHGFVDKPLPEVFDVVRMILSAKEELPDDPQVAQDGLSGEYAEKSLKEWEEELLQDGAA